MKNTKKINFNDYPVGTGVTKSVGTDDYPFEVVENISPTKIKVRAMKAVPTKDHDYFGQQSYTYESTNAEPLELILGKYKGQPCVKVVYYTVEFVENFEQACIEKFGSEKAFWNSDAFHTFQENREKGIPTEGLSYIKRNTSRQTFNFGSARYYNDPHF